MEGSSVHSASVELEAHGPRGWSCPGFGAGTERRESRPGGGAGHACFLKGARKTL